MTTVEIEAQANKGNLATSEFDLGYELRHGVIPEFLEDICSRCGIVWWMREVLSPISVTASNRGPYALPANFYYADMLIGEAAGSTPSAPNLFELTYAGDREDVILAAEYSTVPGQPNAFYVRMDATDGSRDLYLSCAPDFSFSLRGIYRKRIPFADTISSVDMNLYIPVELQNLLVLRLRAEIFLDRFGEGDSRYREPIRRYNERMDRYANSLMSHAGNATRHVYAR